MSRARPRAAAILSGLFLIGGFAVLGAGTAGAVPTSETFSFTGEQASFTVPADVCELTIDAFGAQGGAGSIIEGDNGVFSERVGDELGAQQIEGEPGVGGPGGQVTATVPVTPGETLTILAGGAGGDADGNTAGAGGFNGGGDGGTGSEDGGGGGGGGGSSSVSRGNEALAIAGGGGGGGGFEEGGDGGAGGGPGTDGADAGDSVATGGQAGGAGGAAGTGDVNGTPGSPGAGGTGASALDSGGGGGGGATGGGGGGGNEDEADSGGGGGGGGSGFGPDDGFSANGVRAGDGEVVITYDPEAGSCPVAEAPEAVVVTPRFTG
jgi:hypothetical protein